MNKTKLTIQDVEHTAKLANLDLSSDKIKKLHPQLDSVLGYMSKIQSLETDDVPETTQVTGLENITREDLIDEERMLSQDEALSNAPATHDGYFMVKAILEE